MVGNCRVLQNEKLNKRDLVLQVHPYTITEPPHKGDRWQTYVKGTEKRQIIRASTFDGLIEKLYEFYFAVNIKSITMDMLFCEWLEYKESITESMNTIRRHEQHWKKYFSSWAECKLVSYDFLELQKQCNQLVRSNNMTSKEWQNIKTILSGMFWYAFNKKYIDTDIMKDVKISVKFRQVNKKSGKVQTFQTDEYNDLMKYFDAEYLKSGDIAFMAAKLNFFLGLRVGELVALRWSDIVSLKNLHICREEVKESFRSDGGWKDVYKVVPHTKTHQDRNVPLAPMAISILNELRLKSVRRLSDDDYIFMRNGERLTSRQFNYVLEKACKDCENDVKRSHTVRRTVASRLNAGGVPIDSIREMLGHSNLSTTYGYIYNPLTENETYKKISNAL